MSQSNGNGRDGRDTWDNRDARDSVPLYEYGGSGNGTFNQGSNSYSQQPQMAHGQAQFPDLRSMSPEEREIFLRQVHAIQQQQQFQAQQNLQRARQIHSQQQIPVMRPPASNQAAAQFYQAQMMARPQQFQAPAQNGQPPLPQSPFQPLLNPQYFANPLLFNRPPQAQSHIQPATINPNQLRTPADPAQPVSVPASSVANLVPADAAVLASEGSFNEHLLKFYLAAKFAHPKPPSLAGRPISFLRLFQAVTGLGGFVRVNEESKWPLVLKAFQPLHPEVLTGANAPQAAALFKATYYTFLWPYEQVFVHQRPIDQVEWPDLDVARATAAGASLKNAQSAPASSAPPTTSAAPTAAAAPLTAPTAAPPKLPFIPDSEAQLWRPLKTGMKLPFSKAATAMTLSTAALCLACPRWTLKLEALQILSTMLCSPKIVGTASLTSITALMNALHDLKGELRPSLDKQASGDVLLEHCLLEEDKKNRRLFPEDLDAVSTERRDLNILRQVTFLLRLLVLGCKSELLSAIAAHRLTKSVLTQLFRRTIDYEIEKNLLAVAECLAMHMPAEYGVTVAGSIFKATRRELEHVTIQLSAHPAALVAGTVIALRANQAACPLREGRDLLAQTLHLSTSLAKTVPNHVFLLLQASLQALYNRNFDARRGGVAELALAVAKFLRALMLPSVAFLAAFRGMFDALIRHAEQRDEVRRLMETIVYSPACQLMDGGSLELGLMLLGKLLDSEGTNRGEIVGEVEDGCMLLLEALNAFYRHAEPEIVLPQTSTCFVPQNNASEHSHGTSPSKRIKSGAISSGTATSALLIARGPQFVAAPYSNPVQLICLILDFFAIAARDQCLRPSTQLALIERTVADWFCAGKGLESAYGRQVLTCERIEERLSILHDLLL